MSLITETKNNLAMSMKHYMCMRMMFRGAVFSQKAEECADSAFRKQKTTQIKH